MKSKTKLALDQETIIRLFEKAGIPGSGEYSSSGGGGI